MVETVNPQVTDAVTQSNVKVVSEAPAMALGSLYQAMSHSTGILFENAVNAQQQANVLAQAAANQGVMQMYSLKAGAHSLQDAVDASAPTKGKPASGGS
jgi:hypothetical protein